MTPRTLIPSEIAVCPDCGGDLFVEGWEIINVLCVRSDGLLLSHPIDMLTLCAIHNSTHRAWVEAAGRAQAWLAEQEAQSKRFVGVA